MKSSFSQSRKWMYMYSVKTVWHIEERRVQISNKYQIQFVYHKVYNYTMSSSIYDLFILVNVPEIRWLDMKYVHFLWNRQLISSSFNKITRAWCEQWICTFPTTIFSSHYLRFHLVLFHVFAYDKRHWYRHH